MTGSTNTDMDTLKAQAELQTMVSEANRIAAETRRLGEETNRVNAAMVKDYAQSRQYGGRYHGCDFAWAVRQIRCVGALERARKCGGRQLRPTINSVLKAGQRPP